VTTARRRSAVAEETYAANAASAFGLQLVGVVATGALTLALIRLLGPTGYGRYAIALAVGGLVLLPLDAGLSSATARFLSAEIRRRKAARMIRSGLVLKLAVGAVGAAALVAAASPIAHAYDDEHLVWPIRLVAGVVVGQSLLGFVVSCFTAIRLASRALVVVAVESLGEAALAISLVAGGAGVVGALAGRFAAFASAAFLGILLLNARFRITRRAAKSDRHTLRAIGGYGLTLAIVDAAWAIFVQIDVILIAALITTGAAGEFQAPVRVLALASYPGLAIASALGPQLNVADPDAMLPRFRRALQLLLVFQTLAAMLAAIVGPDLIHLAVGDGYQEAGELTRALAPWVFIAGIAPVASNALDYLGAGRQRLPYAVAAVIVNAVIDVILLPRIGVVGAAIGTDVGIAVFTLGTLIVCRRHVGYHLSFLLADLRPIAVPAAVASVLLTACVVATDESALLIPAAIAASLVFLGLVRRRPPYDGASLRLRFRRG
jgi:O-antigen/teichoic acid export membrane protein